VSEQAVHERLRLARVARGQSIESMADRSGLRVDWLRAIEAGRFSDLPAGVYARSAVRAYAAALQLNVNEILLLSAPLLPGVEDPIMAMRRLNGIAEAPLKPERVEAPSSPTPDWRTIASSAIDAAVMAFGLLVLVTCIIAMGLPMAALDRAAAGPIFGVMLLLATLYYVVFGGIVGQTVGELLTGGHASPDPARLDLRAVAMRTQHALLRESYFVEHLGEWVGRTTAANWHWPLARRV
jgi:transcriptional regulator with XRE-family HTH domain